MCSSDLSLQTPVATGEPEPVPLSDAIGQREQNARRGRWPRSPEEQAQLACDVTAVLDRLPAELRDLAVRLLTQSPSQIARATGVPRSTVYSRMRRLRRFLERADLHGYL